ncbi:MAG TPA: hypothetical protein VJU78_03910 [Chitinophagaceae bacterium]|nr:hypothetical protein [Chitinophagaceae bacterium]
MSHPSEPTNNLRDLISNLMITILPKTMDSRSCFITEIPEKLTLHTDPQLVANVLRDIISFAVEHARQSYIRLSAKVYGHVVIVHVSNRGTLNNDSMQQDVCRLHTMAEKILGSVSISSEKKDSSTLTFGFPNLPPLY